MAKTDIRVIAFLRIDLEEGNPEMVVKLQTSNGAVFPSNNPWGDYSGTGEMLSISAVESSSDTAAKELQIQIRIPDNAHRAYVQRNIFKQIREIGLQNKPVVLHVLETENDPALPTDVPQLVFAGRVNEFQLDAAKINVTAYTPATLLNRIVGASPRYTDGTHRLYVDPRDHAMRFITDLSLAHVNFP